MNKFFYTKNGNKYEIPKPLIEGKHETEGKLISCLAKDITLFQELPEVVNEDYFQYEDSKIFFKVFKELYNKGYSVIDDLAINCEFPVGTEIRMLFDDIDGMSYTEKWKNGMGGHIDNFDKFKNDFLDMVGKIELYKSIIEGKELLESSLAKQTNADDIYRVIDYNSSNSIIGLTEADGIMQLGIDDQFLEDCKLGAKLGIPYGLHSLSRLTMGFHTGNVSMFGAYTGVGKTLTMLSAWYFECAKNKEHIFLYSNETEIHDLKVGLLILTLVHDFGYYELTKNKLNTGGDKITEKDWSFIKKAQEKVNKDYMPYLTVKKPSKNSVKEFVTLMRRYAYRGYKYFVFDTMKGDNRGSSNAIGEFLDQSVEIYETAKKLDVHVFANVQLAIRHKENGVRVLNETHIAGSRQISEVCDIIMCARDILPDEYSGEKHDIKPYRYIKNDATGKYEIKEYVKTDPDKNYILIFLPKNRYGQKEKCVLYEKKGHLGILNEVGFCNPKE
jgi:replicative DNA helicase